MGSDDINALTIIKGQLFKDYGLGRFAVQEEPDPGGRSFENHRLISPQMQEGYTILVIIGHLGNQWRFSPHSRV